MSWRDQEWELRSRPLLSDGEGAGHDHDFSVERLAHFEGVADRIRAQVVPTMWLLTPTVTKSRTAWTLHEGQPLRLPDAPNKNGSMTQSRDWSPVVDIVRWWENPKTHPAMMFYTALRNLDRLELRRLYQGLHARVMASLPLETQRELAPIAQGLAGKLGDEMDPGIQRALTYTVRLEMEGRSYRAWSQFVQLLLLKDAFAVSKHSDDVLRCLPGPLRDNLGPILRELVSTDTMFSAYARRAVVERDYQRAESRAKRKRAADLMADGK